MGRAGLGRLSADRACCVSGLSCQLEYLNQSIQNARSDQRTVKTEVDEARVELNQLKAETDAFATRPVKVTLVPAPPKSELELLTDRRLAVERKRDQLRSQLDQIEDAVDEQTNRKADLDFDAGKHRLALSRLEPDREPHFANLDRLTEMRKWRGIFEEEKAVQLAEANRLEKAIEHATAELGSHPTRHKQLIDHHEQPKREFKQNKEELKQLNKERAEQTKEANQVDNQ